MKRQRCVTSTPGVSVSTTKAVTWLRFLPSISFGGVLAMTTSSFARVPFVHQSFSPLRMKCLPPSSFVGSAWVSMREGSEPTLFSVSAKAEDLAPRDTWEEAALLFFRSEQKQRLRHADRLMRGQKRRDAPAITSDEDGGTRVDLLAQAEASVLPRDLDAECAERGETFDDVVRDFAIAIDLIGVGMLFQERFEPRQELTASSVMVSRRFGTRMDEVHVELAHKDRARERGVAVEAFPRRFGELESGLFCLRTCLWCR